jgi:hypothetical protein
MQSKRAQVGRRGQRTARSEEESVVTGKNGSTPDSLSPEANDLLQMPHAYLIRIAKRQDRERAIVAFMHVPRARFRFSDHRYLVTREHIMALQKAGIAFEDMTNTTN